MNKHMTKAQIFWAPSVATEQVIADTDAVCAIEAARSRFNASMRDLESAFDVKASELRQAFINELSEHLSAEAAE
jgi:hypothetical protein